MSCKTAGRGNKRFSRRRKAIGQDQGDEDAGEVWVVNGTMREGKAGQSNGMRLVETIGIGVILAAKV